MGRGRGSMRAPAAAALLALVAKMFVFADGLAVGTDHACVLLDDASVRCFGLNEFGQLGQGDTAARGQSAATMGDNLGAVDLGAGAVVVDMAAGSDHTCVVLGRGDVKCWGKNSHGQLGLGDTEHRGDGLSEMGDNLPAVELGVNRTAVAVSAEGDRTCVILDSGNVRCWGDAQFGGLGGGDETDTGGDASAPVADSVDLGVSSPATAIGEGPCAVLEDGSMRCWGKGYYGNNGQGIGDNLGDDPGEMGSALPSVPLGAGRMAHSVAGGRDYNCAVLQDGDVKCWGRGEGGQLGNGGVATIGDDPGEMGDALKPVDLGLGETAVQVSAGSQHTCAVLGSGGVKCWGRGFFGNLGLESFRARGHAPGTMGDTLPFVNLGTGLAARSVAAGGERTCAVLDDGSLKCWGNNLGGQLGLGDVAPRGGEPSQMGDLLPAVSLGTNRTAVALARSALPTVPPTRAPTPAPTPAPTAASATPAPSAAQAARAPSTAPVAPPTAAPVTPSPVPATPSPTAAAAELESTLRDAGSDGGGPLEGVNTTLVVSIAAPVSVMMLLGCLFCVAKRKHQDANAASAGAAGSGLASGQGSTRSGLGDGPPEAGVV